MQEYLAGTFDGDDSIGFTKRQLTVTVYQSSSNNDVSPLLSEFKNIFDGSIHGPFVRKEREAKPEYNFWICGKQAKPLLEMIAQKGIIKAPQARLGLDGLSRSTKEHLVRFCSHKRR